MAGPWRLWVIGVALFAPMFTANRPPRCTWSMNSGYWVRWWPPFRARSLLVPLAAGGLGGTGLGLGAIGV